MPTAQDEPNRESVRESGNLGLCPQEQTASAVFLQYFKVLDDSKNSNVLGTFSAYYR